MSLYTKQRTPAHSDQTEADAQNTTNYNIAVALLLYHGRGTVSRRSYNESNHYFKSGTQRD